MPAFATYAYGVDPAYQIPEALWKKIDPILTEADARKPPKKTPGRPRMDNRQALTAIFYVLRTGCQWNALPRSLGARSTVHDRLEEWRKAGVFERVWQVALEYYDAEKGIEWEWQAVDGAMTKAPLGGEKHRQQPDRPGQIGREAEPADRRARRAVGRSRRGSEPTRQPIAGSHLAKRSHRAARSPGAASTPVPGCRV
jgi:transposase